MPNTMLDQNNNEITPVVGMVRWFYAFRQDKPQVNAGSSGVYSRQITNITAKGDKICFGHAERNLPFSDANCATLGHSLNAYWDFVPGYATRNEALTALFNVMLTTVQNLRAIADDIEVELKNAKRKEQVLAT